MEFDKHGFPKPPGFEDERARYRPQVTPRRVSVLFVIVALGALLACAVQFGPDILAGLPRQFGPMMGSRDAIVRRIKIFLFRADYDRALAECDRLIEIEPKDGHAVKATILSQLGRLEDSIAEYTRVIEIDPQDAMSYNNRAYHRALARVELDEALADVEKALEIAGDVSAYVDTRGYLYYLFGRHKEALADFNKVLGDPDATRAMQEEEFGEIYFHRALVLRKLGEEAKAERDFALARKLGFKFDELPEPIERPGGEGNGTNRKADTAAPLEESVPSVL